MTASSTTVQGSPSARDMILGRSRSWWIERAGNFGSVGLVYLASVAVALFIASLLIVAVDGDPWVVAESMVEGSVGSRAAWAETLNQTAPLLIVAVGSSIAFRAGIINIGQEGQFIIGAIVGAALGTTTTTGFGPLMIAGVFALSALGGAIWAAIAAVLKYWRNIHETVSTLLLNLIAYQLVSLAVNRDYLLQMPGRRGTGNLAPQTDLLPVNARLPRPFDGLGMDFHVGIIIGIVLAAVTAVWLQRTRSGFNIRVLGHNPVMARRGGARASTVGGMALILSGAVVGVGGAVLFSGTVFRVQDGFTNNIGWEGLLIAQIAMKRPMVAIPVALFWGALESGGGFLVATGLSRNLVDAVKGLLVLALLVPPVYAKIRSRRQELARASADRT